MRIPACPLILTVLALVTCAPIAVGDPAEAARAGFTQGTSLPHAQQRQRAPRQSPQDVNVRPRVATPLVTVDRNRVPLGERVTFTLTPAGVVMSSRSKVTIYFGDGEHREIQDKIDWVYRKPGNFTYSILVEPVVSPTPKPTPQPALPGVKLSATPTSVEINRPVDFSAQLSHPYPNIKYRFEFADGSPTDWRDSAQATHSYRSAGSYQVYVDIGLGNSGAVKQVGRSSRQAIEVTVPPPKTIAVELTTSKLIVQAKDEVEFLARVDSTELNVRYRFDFGDRSGTLEWQVNPRARHVYSSSGAYQARVEVRVIDSRSRPLTARSKPLPIKVESAPLPGVDLSVIPRSVPAGFPVYFKASADSANSETQYRFNFGDGSLPSAWQSKSEATHIYSLAGDYPAFVEIGSARKRAMAASGKKQVQVLPIIPVPPVTPTPTTDRPPPPPGTPTPSPTGPTPSPLPIASPGPTGSESSGGVISSPSPTATPTPNPNPDGGGSSNWWKYLLLALIIFGGYQGFKYFYAPRPTLVPNIDPGVSGLGTEGGPLAINLQMELDPNVTDGQFTVDTNEGSLIKSERKSDG